MKKVYILFFFAVVLPLRPLQATNVVIIESISYGHTMDTAWRNLCISLGYNASVYPQSTLDSTTWFDTTDILIVSSGVIPLTATGVSTIQAFLQQGGKVYLQCEYQLSYTTNIAFQQIVNDLGGSFTWQGESSGNLEPMNALGSLSVTPDTIAPLSYFWYGTYGAGSNCESHIEPFMEYENNYYGFIFCVPGNNARMITSSDQDWVQSHTSVPLMVNILRNLASPTYSCVSPAGSVNVDLGPDTSICAGQSLTLDATTVNATAYAWNTGQTTASITVSIPGTYSVSVTTSGCSGNDTIVVSQLAGLPFTYALSDSQLCSGSSATLTVSVSNAQVSPATSVVWTDSVQALISPDSTTSYTISAVSCGVPDSAFITVHIVPSSPFSAQLSQNQVCFGDSSLLTITGMSNAQISPLTGTGRQDSTHIYLYPDTSTRFLITGTLDCGGADTAAVILNVDHPVVAVSSGDTTFCAGDSTRICATVGFGSYFWNVGDTGVCITAKFEGNYSVVATDQNNCSAESNRQAIYTFPLVAVAITVSGDTFTAYNAVSYQWFQGGTAVPGATSNIFIAMNSGYYSVAAVDSNGCTENSSLFHYTLGIENLAEEGINVYPNPLASGSWQLTVQPGWIGSKAELFDDNGRSVFKTQIRNIQSEMGAELAPGVYLLRISSANRYAVMKLEKL